MTSLRIALLQLSDEGDINKNLRKGLEACERAAVVGADIALLPELWGHGYEANLNGNLYRVWNRMSSVSYMPLAV